MIGAGASTTLTTTSTHIVQTPEAAASKSESGRSPKDLNRSAGSSDRMSRPGQSRENTPSTLSSHSLDTAPLDRTTSSASVSVSMDEGSGSSFGQASQETRNDDEVERFLRKIDMEKKVQALQQRLELASVKASNGWTDMTISEIETQRLTPKSARRRSNLTIDPSSPTSSRLAYEPPSPSRPWQLIDVLWQPLPPPSNGKYPMSPGSPSSPRKRSREEYGLGHPSPRSGIFQQQQQQPPRVIGQPPNGHRRSNSTAFHATASPLRQFKEGEKKKRSHSHSTHTTTRQDVDAAKALTFMLGSGSGSGKEGSGSPTDNLFGPPLNAPSSSLPIPSPGQKGQASFRARAQSEVHASPRKKRSASPPATTATANAAGNTDDNTAADLMLFLAHSPSPVTRVKPSPSRLNEVKGAARILFQDPEPKDVNEPRVPSNLASAPPITNNEPTILEEVVAVEPVSST